MTLAGELTVVAPINDQSLHLEMVRWAAQQIREGNGVPLDGWFPYLNLGLAQFHHYQSLPHLITAFLSLPFGVDTTLRWAGYLLFALFPLSVYAGTRLLGWSPWVSASAALVTPLLVSATGYGYEADSYTWLGNGLWSQEWGMYLLPLAWGLAWRAVHGAGRAAYALAALTLAMTIATHFITGYLALLSIGVFVIVGWHRIDKRLARALLVFGGALAIASWVVVPLLTDASLSNLSAYEQNTTWLNSYGAPQVLDWLFTGQIFDDGRFPIVSLLVAMGAVVCITRFRRDARARALLSLMILSLLLFSGRATFGWILNALPGSADLPFQRFIMGVHLAGDLLAGVGLAWAGGVVLRKNSVRMPRLGLLPTTAGLVAAALLLTLPAWLNRAAYAESDATAIASQAASDHSDGAALDVLIADIKARGDGRTYAGLPSNWGARYDVGDVPVYEYLAGFDVDEVGFLLRSVALAGDNEAAFDQNDPAQYQLYGIRYLLMPTGMQPPVPSTLLAVSGRHQLWNVQTSGYLEVVDTAGIIVADRTDMARQMQPFLQSPSFHQGQLAIVAFDGGSPASPTLPITALPALPAGTSTDALVQIQDGFFAGYVNTTRTASVVLKATYDPRWRVKVDGRIASTYMVVPGFVAVTVAPGAHAVVFQYVPYATYAPLLGIGGLTVVLLLLGPWCWRRWGVRRLRGRSAEATGQLASARRRLFPEPELESPS